MKYLLSFLTLTLCLAFVSYSQAAEQLQFGQVYNGTFTNDTDVLYFQVQVPFDPLWPVAQHVVFITYIPYTPYNVSASFNNPFPNASSEYIGSDRDGSNVRGIVLVGTDMPQEEKTLYISITKVAATEYDFFGLDVEFPGLLTSYPINERFETTVEIAPWQTKWFLVNYPENEAQFFSAIRAEFCDEPQGEVSYSLVFPEATVASEGEVINPCGCDDFIVDTRDANLIAKFTENAQQMFIIQNAVNSLAMYAGLFYMGPSISPSLSTEFTQNAARAQCPERAVRTRSPGRSMRADEGFSMRLTMWGQENFPTVRTKYTKPDRVNNDLLANVDDTPYCNYWASNNFTGYFSLEDYVAWDAACFLEKYAENFTVYAFESLVGEFDHDRVLVLQEFFERKVANDTYFNIVHSNSDCGSFAYYHALVPMDGWNLEKPKAEHLWDPVAIGLVVLFGFLFVVFLLSSILLISRLREYTNYRKINSR